MWRLRCASGTPAGAAWVVYELAAAEGRDCSELLPARVESVSDVRAAYTTRNRTLQAHDSSVSESLNS